MRKIIVFIILIIFSFSSLFAQDSKAELDSLKRDVDSLKNELEILKIKRDMEKLQGELDTLKSSTPKTSEAPQSTPLTSLTPTNEAKVYPFKKNIFSINFAYSLYAVAGSAILDNHYDIMKKHSDKESFRYIIPGTTSVDFYGINLSSERMLKTNISFAMEYGWNGGSVSFADSSMSELKADFQIIPVALGFKIYTKKYSPYGFFVYPKVGATIIQADGTIVSRTQYTDYDPSASRTHGRHSGMVSQDLYYDSALTAETNSINVNFDYGIYASVEFGFRIPLFRKALSKKKMELGIDISLLDIGYYIKPYHENTVSQLSKMYIFNGIDEYEKYYRIRFMPLPRFGLTFRF